MNAAIQSTLISSELFGLFKLRAEAVSAEVHRVATKDLAIELIVRTLRQEGVKEEPDFLAVCAEARAFGPAEKQTLAAVGGVKFNFTRDEAAQSKVGISQMDWALADTGTLVQDARAVDKRLASMLPPLHIAMVATGAILPNLSAYLSTVDPTKSVYSAFITGPSRTADIERVLTIGVHGPSRLMIVMVDDLEVTA